MDDVEPRTLPRTLIALCGRSFSGKSTLAREIVGTLSAELVGLDAINEERGLHGGDGIPVAEWVRTNELAAERAAAILRTGRSVVVDDTNSLRFLRDGWRRLADDASAAFALVYVHAPDELIRQRLQDNRRSAGRHDVADEVMAEHLAQFEEPEAEEAAIAVESGAGVTGEDVLRAIEAQIGPITTDVIVIGGRSGSGKTSVAAEASRILAEAGIRHAVIEGDNLDQAFPEPWRDGIDLAERNLAAMWRNYQAVGYTRLIFTNTVSVLQLPALTGALGPNVRSFGVLLTASDETAAHRLARREIGTGLEEHIARSSAAAALLDSAAAAYRIATDDRSVQAIAGEVLRAAGWLATS